MVVFPDPKNPVKTVMGISFVAFFKGCVWFMSTGKMMVSDKDGATHSYNERNNETFKPHLGYL